MTKNIFSLIVLIAGLLPQMGSASLIGEVAPPLVVKEWIKGQPTVIKAGTNIYVMGILNTTGTASRAGVLCLSALQQQFKTNGVLVVGICDEPVETIKEFVRNSDTNIDFAVAADDQRKTSSSYMLPVGRRGVPYTFIVGTNRNVLWHGHPLRGLEQAMNQIITGRYDMEREKFVEIANRQMEQYLGLRSRGDSRAKPAGQRLLANRTNDVELLCEMAVQIATSPRTAKPDFALAGQALDQAEKLSPTNMVRVMITRAVLLYETGKRNEGLALAKQAAALAQSESDKSNAQAFLRTMEARLEMEKKSQSNTNQIPSIAVTTNGPAVKISQTNNARPLDFAPAGNTNQTKSSAGHP